MPLECVTVYVDSDDLAIIKEAAARTQTSEAEIIREGIHLAAMRVRRRSEPPHLRRFVGGEPVLADRVDEILGDDDPGRGWADERSRASTVARRRDGGPGTAEPL
jgi:hypothetical protein